MSDGPYVVRHLERTATGLRNRYRSRTTYEPFWAWMNANKSVVDGYEDWPWAYWSFKTPEAEAEYVAMWGEPSHTPSEDDTMDTPVPEPVVSRHCDMADALYYALQESIQDEVNREIIAELRGK